MINYRLINAELIIIKIQKAVKNFKKSIANLRALSNLQNLKFLFCTNFNRNCWEKNIQLTPWNLFFKFSQCLTLYPIISVHVNWIVLRLTAKFPKFCLSADITQSMLRSNETLTSINNSVCLWKMIVDGTREVQLSIKDIWRNNCFRIARTCCAIKFL